MNGESTVLDESIETMPVRYSVTDAGIATLRNELTGLKADTPAGYDEVRRGIAQVRGLRTGIEKRRVELKADALSWGRKVDSEAKRLTAQLLEIEEPLKVEKATVDDAKERAARAEQDRIAAEEKSARHAVEARLKAVRDAEAAKLKAEREELDWRRAILLREQQAEMARQKAEQDRIAAEEKAARDRIEAERRQVEAERRAVEVEKIRLAQEEANRVAREEAKELAAKRAEFDRQEAERRLVEAEKAKEAERLRREAARPDVEKVKEFGRRLREIEHPVLQSNEVIEFMAEIEGEVESLADRCERFMSETS